MTIKRLSKEYDSIMRDLWNYCFMGGEPPDNDEDWYNYLDFIDLESSLGYFVDGKLTSTYVIIPYKMFVRGVLMDMGGIAAVATFPQYRRKKQITALATESLKVMRSNKQFISVLYPFKYSFYRKYGYENCADFSWVITPPKNILIPKNFIPLEIREITHEESFDILKPIREKIGSKYNLIMYKDSKSWMTQYLNKKYNIFVIEDNNKIVGYFITFLKKMEGDWNVRLNLRDILVSDHNARLTVYDYIRKHTDQNKDASITLMGDEHITDYFEDLWEGDFKYQMTGGPMFRIVDIEGALKQLEFAKELNFTFSLKIRDEYAPWNEEPLEITIINGKSTIEKSKTKDFDLKTDIKAFTQLFTGYRDIFQLIELNKIKIKKEKITKINKAFPKKFTRLKSFF